MAAEISITPAEPTAIADACVVSVTGADANKAAGFDASKYPTEPEMRYYFAFVKGGVEYGRSYVFGVGADGQHDFVNYIFPSDGAWIVNLCDVADDSVVEHLDVTVS